MEIVSEESKAFANTVFLKKSMYYNMRSRIVKRHAGHVVRKARAMVDNTTEDEKNSALLSTLLVVDYQHTFNSNDIYMSDADSRTPSTLFF